MLYNLCLIIPVSEVCVGLFQPSVMSVVLHCCVLTWLTCFDCRLLIALKITCGIPWGLGGERLPPVQHMCALPVQSTCTSLNCRGGQVWASHLPSTCLFGDRFFSLFVFSSSSFMFSFSDPLSPKGNITAFCAWEKRSSFPNPKDVTNNTRN